MLSMKTVLSAKRAALFILIALVLFLSGCFETKKEEAENALPVELQILGITDFHGYIRPYFDGNGKIQTPEGQVQVGGGAYLSAHLQKLKEGRANSILVSAGDNFSGWPFEISAFLNEPTIEFLNYIGVEMSAAGNHELDVSAHYLTEHMIKGKCTGVPGKDGCFQNSAGKRFEGAKFEYLSANIRDAKSGELLLKPYTIKQIPDGRGGIIPVGFIGLTEAAALTKEHNSVQFGLLETDPAPGQTAGTPYDPNARALVGPANRYAKELQEQGVETIIVLLHEGGSHSGSYNGCQNPKGPAIEFAKYASPAIDVILTGHYHNAFNCSIPDPDGRPRPVLEGSYHGKLISEVVLKIDPATKDVIREQTEANNRLVTRDIEPDPNVQQMLAYWLDRAKTKREEPVGQITGKLARMRNEHGESTLLNVIADAFYAAGKADPLGPSDFALVAFEAKKDLSGNTVTFGELWDATGIVQSSVAVTFTGEQIKRLLEEQWVRKAGGKESFQPFSVSYNVQYRYDKSKPIGSRIDPAHVMVNGEPLDLKKTYRVITTGQLTVSGAETYPAFQSFAEPYRVSAWTVFDYFKQQGTVKVPELNRILPVQ
jgi:5'-nucleotidase